MDSHNQQSKIKLDGDWNTLFNDPAKQQLETDILPRYLPHQRWFAGKARTIATTRLVESAELPADPGRLFVAFIEVAFTSGPTSLYSLPLAIRDIDPAGTAPPDNTFVRLNSPQGDAWLVDAATETGFAQALLASIADEQRIPAASGTIATSKTTAFENLRGASSDSLTPRTGPISSSNSLVFLGERLLLKLFRRLEPGINPDLEVGRFLTEQTNFTRLPQVAGSVEYQSSQQSEPTTLAILQESVPHQGDGWTHALDDLRHYYERVLPREVILDEGAGRHVVELARQPCPASVADVLDPCLASATMLGKRTAQLHAALASRDDIPEFAPEPLTADDMRTVFDDLRAQAARALAELADHRQNLPQSQHDNVDWLLREAEHRLEAAIQATGNRPPNATKSRIHGDFHLGQVIRVQDDFVVLDFEGEPTRSIEDRRCKYSPVRDLAGMLRSFHYAAFAGAFALAESRGTELNHLAAWAELWQRWIGATFLREYLQVAGSESFIPASDDELARLLDSFTLGKAFYELVYELNNRPEWARIPLSGLTALLDELEQHEPEA